MSKQAPPAESATTELTSAAAPNAPAPSLTGKTVLHAGDSMVGGSWGLTRALEAKLSHEGAKVVRYTKVSETVASFDKNTVRDLIKSHEPDIVILTLGTNDVFVPFPQAYAANVQSIVKKIGARECWWIGPPTWKPDTGIVGLIRDNAGPCRFFDSSSLKLQRASDGIHPTDKGGADWADKFWTSFRAPRAAEAPGVPLPPPG